MKEKITEFLKAFTPCKMGEFQSYKRTSDDESLGDIEEALNDWLFTQALNAEVLLIKIFSKSDYDIYALSIAYEENDKIVLLSYPVFSY